MKRCWINAIALAALAWWAGCDDSATRELRVVRLKEELPGMKEERAEVSRDEVLDMVRSNPAPAEWIGDRTDLNVEQALQTMLDKEQGQILFPRWEVRRRGHQQYEVQFTYTLLRDDQTIDRQGYSWTVDHVLKLIAPPVRLDTEALEEYSGRRYTVPRPGDADVRRFNQE